VEDLVLWLQRVSDATIAEYATRLAEAVKTTTRDVTSLPLRELDERAQRILSGEEAEPEDEGSDTTSVENDGHEEPASASGSPLISVIE
jgi:hypothetical protein